MLAHVANDHFDWMVFCEKLTRAHSTPLMAPPCLERLFPATGWAALDKQCCVKKSIAAIMDNCRLIKQIQ